MKNHAATSNHNNPLFQNGLLYSLLHLPHMNFRIYLLTVTLLLALLVIGEIVNQKHYTRPLPHTEIPFRLDTLKDKMDPRFGSFLRNNDSSCEFIFLDYEMNINFYNPSLNTFRKSDMSPHLKNLKLFSARLINNLLYLLDCDHKTFSVFNVGDSNRPTPLHVWDLNNILNWNQYYLRFQYRNLFEIRDSLLYLSYGRYNTDACCLDTTAWLMLNLADERHNFSVKKIFPYPSEFLKGEHYNLNTWICFPGNNMLCAGFHACNRLYRCMPGQTVFFVSEFERHSWYRKFEREKLNNLGYIRWHTFTDESNENAIILNNGTLLIIKRLRREEIKDISKYEYYLLDSTFSLLSHNTFQQAIHPGFCYAWKKGFLVLTENLDKAFYYEAY